MGFLEPPDAFLERMPRVERLGSSAWETGGSPRVEGPIAVVPAAP